MVRSSPSVIFRARSGGSTVPERASATRVGSVPPVFEIESAHGGLNTKGGSIANVEASRQARGDVGGNQLEISLLMFTQQKPPAVAARGQDSLAPLS
jgi:hypothetical protein